MEALEWKCNRMCNERKIFFDLFETKFLNFEFDGRFYLG